MDNTLNNSTVHGVLSLQDWISDRLKAQENSKKKKKI